MPIGELILFWSISAKLLYSISIIIEKMSTAVTITTLLSFSVVLEIFVNNCPNGIERKSLSQHHRKHLRMYLIQTNNFFNIFWRVSIVCRTGNLWSDELSAFDERINYKKRYLLSDKAETDINAAEESSKHFESFAILYIPIIGDILCMYN